MKLSGLNLIVNSLFLQLLEFLWCSVGLCVFILLPVPRMVSVPSQCSLSS